METAGGKIEYLLTSEPTIHKEAWHQMKEWYKVASVCKSPPSQLNIERITAERVMLHQHIPPQGRI